MNKLESAKVQWSKSKIVLVHLALFVLLGVIYFFLCEPIVKLIFPEIYNVVFWIYTLIVGLVLLFILLTISCLIFLTRRKGAV